MELRTFAAFRIIVDAEGPALMIKRKESDLSAGDAYATDEKDK